MRAVAAFAVTAWIMAMILMTFGPKYGEFEALSSRVSAIEGKKCVLMAVNTPNGVASICAQ